MAAPSENGLVPVMIVFDTETGGLDPQRCGVCQVCMHSVRLDNFERMGNLNIYIKPYNRREGVLSQKKKKLKSKYDIEDEENGVGELMAYEEQAEKVHGLSVDFLRENGMDLDDACHAILDFVTGAKVSSSMQGKPFFVGQNTPFDIAFLQQIMEYTGLWNDLCKVIQHKKDFYGNKQPVTMDTISLAYLALSNTKVGSYALGNLCEIMGIEIDDAHDADSDVTATEDIVRLLTAKMRSSDEVDGEGSGMVSNKQEKKRVHFKI